MVIINAQLIDVLGYHLPNSMNKLSTMNRLEIKELNILNSAGYLPVFAGAFRINRCAHLMINDPSNPYIKPVKFYCVVQIARGVVEFLGGGLLFLIPDLILTLGRAFGKWELDLVSPNG